MTTSLTRLSVRELCECDGLTHAVVVELVQYEIARPVAGSSVEDWVFDATSAHWMLRAVRLRRDLEVDWVAAATLVDLLREREHLRQENESLRQRIERFESRDEVL